MRLVTIFLFLLLSSCMSMQHLRKSWEGEHIDDATALWGSPDSIAPNSFNGGSTYTWTTLITGKYGAGKCKRTLVSNSSGTVVKGSYSGCPYFSFVSKE